LIELKKALEVFPRKHMKAIFENVQLAISTTKRTIDVTKEGGPHITKTFYQYPEMKLNLLWKLYFKVNSLETGKCDH
jgi:hypothetical protein